MPYKIAKRGNGYKVVEKSGGKHPGREFSKEPQTKEKALAQLRAIEANGGGK